MNNFKKIYISKDSNPLLSNYLQGLGYQINYIVSENVVDLNISNHPDIFLCKLGVSPDSPIYFADRSSLGKEYPNDIGFNAACTGKFFIHNLSHTNEALLQTAKLMGMTLINVNQGYTKCSITIVDENSLITYDDGIVRACKAYSELDVLQISPGFIHLDGYDTGFIGGASGRVNNQVIFNGDLSAHPDFHLIKNFIENRGLKCKWFPEYKLTDIGSII